MINGAPAWHKPFKFFVSGGLYAFTFAWYLGQAARARPVSAGRRSLAWWLGTGIWVALTIELGPIAMQALAAASPVISTIATPLDAGSSP